MNWEAISAVGEIVGAIAVVATLMYLAKQIRQSTAMMEAEMSQNRAEAAMGEARALYNSDYMPELLVAVRKGEPLTDLQAERFGHWFRGFNRRQDNLLRQYRQGLLTDEIPRSVRWAVRDLVAESLTTREMWAATKEIYSDDYVDLVDRVLADYLDAGRQQ